MKMKLMTINAHSLIEENYQQKLMHFVNGVAAEKPHIIAMQEVNQSITAEPVKLMDGYVPVTENAVIRADNHVMNAVKMLRERGLDYYWTWLPIKLGYGRFDEGVAVMSLTPVTETDVILVSDRDDYNDWHTRKIVGIKTLGQYFYSVHYGWWQNGEDSFCRQWDNTLLHLKNKEKIWLMGDFNNPSEIYGEGYELMMKSGYYDSFCLAEHSDTGITANSLIDGWKGRAGEKAGMRIDLILSDFRPQVYSSEVIFNGENYPVISDHYGVIADIKGDL